MGEKNDDMGEGMQCSDHPLMNSGGICAFCLQEKLGKLVSSSSSFEPNSNNTTNNRFFFSDRSQVAAHSSSSPSPEENTKKSNLSHKPTNPDAVLTKNRIPFVIAQKKIMAASSSSSSSSDATNLMLKRTRSVAPSRVFDGDETRSWINTTPRRRSFWSFLYLKKRGREKEKGDGDFRVVSNEASSNGGSGVVGKENESPNSSCNASSFGRKVARSRSVGCGSRSFSGDFLEKISTGFGDCTLRRVESQREPAKPNKIVSSINGVSGSGSGSGSSDVMIKENVKCGGIFAGFGSSSSYWVSEDFNGGRISTGHPHSRNRSWGWAFASPMRAFRPSKPPAISEKDPEEGIIDSTRPAILAS